MADEVQKPTTVSVQIDGNEVKVPPGTTILNAAKTVSKHIPHFCYHPGLTIVGQCRMCYVEIEGQKKLATACSTTVAEGMKIKTDSDFVKRGQNSTLEFVLLDHPLDCPICDRGGECKLQDYTYEHGPSRSRMTEEKELLKKHHPISEQVVLDQERCILCTRCVRFSSEVDGRNELVVNERASKAKIDVFNDQPMLSAFSGNVVDLCPVGALTAKDYRFKARPWELRHFDGICTGCSAGCNVEIHTKHRHPGIARPDRQAPTPEIERLVPRENQLVNDWWMCDAGRWGYHFNNNEAARLYGPMLRRDQNLEASSLKEVQATLENVKGEWEFWIWDEAPHEEIAWAKSLRESWEKRGRKVAGFNPLNFSKKFLDVWAKKADMPLFAGAAEYKKYKKVVSTLSSYRDLEVVVPILALTLGQRIRKGTLEWEQRKSSEFFSKKDDLDSTLYLTDVPRTENDLKVIESIPTQAHVLPLFTHLNSRGLLNEGITPIEILEGEMADAHPRGPIFVFAQSTQRKMPRNFVNYIKQAPFVVVADSQSGKLSDVANILLPLELLYETRFTSTNVGNLRQVSGGVQIRHPNYPQIQRGNTSIVAPSLQLI